ncbi:phospholipid-binding lipoprotein MlaA [Marinospirillum alkaliphilum DSM 21637]|uniref:Phospholipid-binding lipoprotein MlaA n=2 Tax=Marinospirillum TaxID=64968 RepID=A0A1K1TZ73_9GAMM|nr:phospholipid-binding lipoprotein MlaA [Marinospirillum alkaliphilum DSM 21637]
MAFCRTVTLMLLVVFSLPGHADTVDWGEDRPHPRDPYESWNRKVFAFNETLDGWVLKPIARGYRAVTPGFVRKGVGNFFANLGEIPNFANNLLQAKPAAAGRDAVRFTLNTTVGVLGLFDPATSLGIRRSEEDFGQTLNTWGVPQGPYIVWPFIGGQTLSHTVSLPVDYYYLNPVRYAVDEPEIRYGLAALYAVHQRSELLDAEKLIRGDRYTFIRDAYLQRRSFLVNDGRMDSDPFLDDEDFFFDDDDFAY